MSVCVCMCVCVCVCVCVREGVVREVEEYMNYAQEHGLVGHGVCVCVFLLSL